MLTPHGRGLRHRSVVVIAVLVVAAVALAAFTTATDTAQAGHDPAPEGMVFVGGATTTLTLAYNGKHINLWNQIGGTGTTKTGCSLNPYQSGHQGTDCGHVAPPGYYYSDRHWDEWPDPPTFDLLVCAANNALIVEYPHTDGGVCGTFSDDATTTTTQGPTTTTTTTTTTTLSSSCSTGHSHTGDGRNCHTHTFVPNTCGASYQTINGTGHDTRFVRTVPPCTIGTGTTTTTTTAVLTCATLIEEGADHRWVSWLCDDTLNRAVTIIEPVLPPGAPMEQTVDPNATVYQAPSVWHAEREILAAAAAGLDTVCAVADSYDGWAENLSEDQEAAVNHICSTGDTISTVVGAAGTGKTTMMKAAAARWTRAGYKVTGITVAAQAGEILRKEAGLAESRTVAGILRGRAGPPPPGVWIVDEAGMVSTVDLAAVVAAAAKSGSKIALIGDPKQLPAINAGGMFRLLTERHAAVELDTGWRFAEDWEYANSRLLAQGDHTAIDTLNDNGRVHAAANWTDIVANVVKHHRHALRSDQTFLATAHTRAHVHTLNMALRHNLELGPELLRLQRSDLNVETPIATGDIIITGRNDPNLTDSRGDTVLNGARWRVLGRDRNHLHVERLDSPGITAALPAEYVLGANEDGRPWIEHALATTIHRSQGQTVDHSVAVAAAGANRSQLYVQTTRGRHENHVIVPGADDPNQALAVLRTALD